MTAPRAILHVDMDAFYASVEQRDRPELRGQPRHRRRHQQSRRGRGGELRSAQVRRALGHADPRSAAPLPARHLRASRACRCTARSRTRCSRSFTSTRPIVEGLSLDEAFLDVTASLALKGDAVSIARGIKQRIRADTQLAASVGVAPNKLVAKIASDLEKPDGLTVVNAGQPARGARSAVGAPPARPRPQAGRARRSRGPRHASAQLRAAPDAVLWPIFGRDSQRMRERAAGIDERPVMSEWDEKSISAEETFFTDLADHARMQCGGAAARRPRRHAHARAEPRRRLRAGEDPPRRLHHVHAAEALRALDHRLAHDRQDRRRAARPPGSPSSRARRCGC